MNVLDVFAGNDPPSGRYFLLSAAHRQKWPAAQPGDGGLTKQFSASSSVAMGTVNTASEVGKPLNVKCRLRHKVERRRSCGDTAAEFSYLFTYSKDRGVIRPTIVN